VIDLQNLIQIEEKETGPSRLSEVDEDAKNRLAEMVQQRLRGKIDPGIDLKSAKRSQGVRVTAKGSRLVIDEKDQAAVLRGGMQPQRDISESRAGGMADLFTMSSGVPQAVRNPDGTTTLAFRSVAAEDLFNIQKQNEQNRMVEETVTETLRMGIVDAFEDAATEVDRRHPEDKLK